MASSTTRPMARTRPKSESVLIENPSSGKIANVPTRRVRFVRSGPALWGRGEESSSAPSERNAKHEHDRKPHLHRMPRNRSAAHESDRQADQISGSTTGMENRFIEGMSHTRHHATVRNTGSGSRLLEDAH